MASRQSSSALRRGIACLGRRLPCRIRSGCIRKIADSIRRGRYRVLFLQTFELIENCDEFLSEVRETVFDSWWHFRIALLLDHPKPDEFRKPFVQDLRRQPLRSSLESTRTIDALSNLCQDVERPFAPKALLDDLGNRRTRIVHVHRITHQMVRTTQKSAWLIAWRSIVFCYRTTPFSKTNERRLVN